MVPPKSSPHHTDFFPVRRRGGSSGEAMSSFFSALPLMVAKELLQCFESKIHIFSVSAGSDPLSTWWRAVHWKSRCSNGCGTGYCDRVSHPCLGWDHTFRAGTEASTSAFPLACSHYALSRVTLSLSVPPPKAHSLHCYTALERKDITPLH